MVPRLTLVQLLLLCDIDSALGKVERRRVVCRATTRTFNAVRGWYLDILRLPTERWDYDVVLTAAGQGAVAAARTLGAKPRRKAAR